MDIIQYDRFLTPEDSDAVARSVVFSNKWEYGHASNAEGFRFWYQELTNDTFFNTYMFNLIKEKTNSDYKLDRVYANGQTYGLCGGLHRDREPSKDEKYKTFLYYAHPQWNLVWGGQTVFYDESTGSETAILPIPNTAVLFDSTILHVGLEPTRHCNDLRVSIAFKLTVI